MPGRLVFSTTADGASSATERMRIDSTGAVGVGGSAGAAYTMFLLKNPTGATTTFGLRNGGTIQSDVTGQHNVFYSRPATSAAAFSLGMLIHYRATQGTIGLGSSVTTQYGFLVDSDVSGATNNYGFYSNIASGTGRWNFYANGTADNYFAGNVGVGTTSVNPIGTTTNLAVFGSATSSISLRSSAGTGGYLSTDGSNYFQFLGIAATASVYIGANNTTRISISPAGIISLGAASGSESFRVTPIASSVNYGEISGGAAGQGVTLRALGSDTNIPFALGSKGSGSLFFVTARDAGFTPQFVVTHTASAVNYLQVTGAATGLAAVLSATGSDANVSMNLLTKAAGIFDFLSDGGGVRQFRVSRTASAVNYLQVAGGATGGGAVISSQGSDANIPIDHRVKGASYHIFTTNNGSSAQFLIQNTTSSVNYLQVTGGATGNSAKLNASGSDTNIDITLTPKGTGVVRDANGNIRAVPKSGATKTSSYTLTTADVGDFIEIGSGGSITIPDATFATGDIVSLFNNTSGDITVTCTITTAYIGGTDTDKATVTLATRGVATILFISGTVCVISGNVT